MQILPEKVQKVMDYIAHKNIYARLKMCNAPAKTAQAAADILKVEVGQIGNSLIFQDEHTCEMILIVASGAHRVDLDQIQIKTGRTLIKASGKDIKEVTGFAIGGVPPVAHTMALVTYLDEALLAFDFIWVAAGIPESLCEIAPNDLEVLTGGEWIAVI